MIMGYRRDALSDKDVAPIAQMYKTKGNAAYGSILMNQFKFCDIYYLQGEGRSMQMVTCKRLKKK